MEDAQKHQITNASTKVVFDSYDEQPVRKTANVDDLYDESEAEASPMKRAIEVQSNLDPKFPTFVKSMIHSNVVAVFFMKFPKEFSRLHMPGHDAAVALVDTGGKEFQTKYLVAQNTLSAGWKSFSTAHELNVGDVLVFQLIKPYQFKVYIVRKNEVGEVDGALALLHLQAEARGIRRCSSSGTGRGRGMGRV